MIRRSKPIRRTPVKKKRGKPRPGRLDAAGVQAQRLRIYERDGGKCKRCEKPLIFNAPDEWHNSFHRAHIKAKRNGLDNDNNVQAECGECHRKYHAYGPSMTKPCPPKEKR